jgi:hypothetical protein
VKKPVLRELIVNALKWGPYDHGATATQVLRYLRSRGHENVKLSSLSSQLCKLAKSGLLEVLPEFGPRKGNGYTLAKHVWRCGDCGLTQPDTYDSDCDGCHSNNLVLINGGRI